MVLIRNNVQKESTYGWYPSQVNVYENPRAKHGYDKECLFRYWQSGLHPANSGRGVSVTPPGFRGSMKSTPQSRAAKSVISKSSAPEFTLTGSRPVSLTQNEVPPQFVFEQSRPSSAVHNNIPTPRMSRGYHGWQPQPTIIGIVDPEGPFIAPSPQLAVTKEEDSLHIETPKPNAQVTEVTKQLLTTRPSTPAQQLSGSYRAQSASLRRPRATPTRPIKSAGSRSQTAHITLPVSQGVAGNAFSKINTQQTKNPESHRSNTPHRPHTKQEILLVAEPEEDEVELERPSTPVNLRTPTPVEPEEPTYDSQLDKYGWLAEIPGDPLNLKRITERLPYTVRCEEPNVAEYPYKTRVMAGDTFFLNTIPRKPMTFAVHPEWQSEGFVAKRKELEKQGRKFHTRNFGFVY